jgi:hypothetical protein
MSGGFLIGCGIVVCSVLAAVFVTSPYSPWRFVRDFGRSGRRAFSNRARDDEFNGLDHGEPHEARREFDTRRTIYGQVYTPRDELEYVQQWRRGPWSAKKMSDDTSSVIDYPTFSVKKPTLRTGW